MESGVASSDVQSAVSETQGFNPASLLLPPGVAIPKAMRPLLDYLTLSISQAIISRMWTGLYSIHRYSLDFSEYGWFFGGGESSVIST
jgi:hypothetical protein